MVGKVLRVLSDFFFPLLPVPSIFVCVESMYARGVP